MKTIKHPVKQVTIYRIDSIIFFFRNKHYDSAANVRHKPQQQLQPEISSLSSSASSYTLIKEFWSQKEDRSW